MVLRLLWGLLTISNKLALNFLHLSCLTPWDHRSDHTQLLSLMVTVVLTLLVGLTLTSFHGKIGKMCTYKVDWDFIASIPWKQKVQNLGGVHQAARKTACFSVDKEINIKVHPPTAEICMLSQITESTKWITNRNVLFPDSPCLATVCSL